MITKSVILILFAFSFSYFYATQIKCPDPLRCLVKAFHSTETAVLRVLSDILLALDSGNLVMLTLLDLSAAF